MKSYDPIAAARSALKKHTTGVPYCHTYERYMNHMVNTSINKMEEDHPHAAEAIRLYVRTLVEKADLQPPEISDLDRTRPPKRLGPIGKLTWKSGDFYLWIDQEFDDIHKAREECQ